MKLALIDSYDSFTHNLVHLAKTCGAEVEVMRNDQIDHGCIESSDALMFSPGPGIPESSGELKSVIERYKKVKPMFGVCLGHQAIAEVFGGQNINLSKVYHGVQTRVNTKGSNQLFKDLPATFKVGRYHSWVVSSDLPDGLLCIAEDDQDQVMALAHGSLPIWGVQFHPESILSEYGKEIIQNFLKRESTT